MGVSLGSQSPVSMDQNIVWSCGTSNTQCRATLTYGGNCGTPGDYYGICGFANGHTFSTKPTSAQLLCLSGTVASAVSGTGPWTWTCTGSSSTSSCSANKGSDDVTSEQYKTGVCGSASSGTFPTAPTANLCFVGTATWVGTYDGGTSWGWSCLGTESYATCRATKGDATSTPTPTPLPTPGTGTIQIPGYCGNAATSYSNSDTQYSGSFCYTGVQEPVNPEFPPQNGSSQWVCRGLTGGTDSSTCTATRNSILPQTCSTYTASAAIPIGYGSPFNQLSGSKESLLSITCSSTTTGATANAGSTQSNTYTYKTGFVSQNGAWSPIDFSGNPDPNNAGWFKGVATASLPAASSSQNFVAAFICQYDGGKWKCGCRDSACSQNYWTLQAYQK